jgi:deoxyribonuclease V
VIVRQALRHPWRLKPKQAVALQRRLAGQVVLRPAPVPRRMLGLDCAFAGDQIFAVGVVWDVGSREVIETRAVRRHVTFPYVPGLLSFREVPALLAVVRRIRTPFQGILCDGQGIAHPRRFGLASHLGLLLGLPAVGCAKSRLCGRHDPPGSERGDAAPLLDDRPSGAAARAERIGTVLRTRTGVKPVFVSPGHLTDHASSVAWVLACGASYRVPEPTRVADHLVTRFRREGRYRGGIVRQWPHAGR